MVLVQTSFFGETSIRSAIELALFLHLGTFLAALVYFREDVRQLLAVFFNYSKTQAADKTLLHFLIISTIISGLLGYGLLELVTIAEDSILPTTKVITAGIGILLLVTAFLQFRGNRGSNQLAAECSNRDAGILGVVQGFAALPGLSRSGLTVAALLLRGYGEAQALRLSFLMSLPIVLGGNILLNINKISVSLASVVGLLCSFVFGLVTIGVLLRIARKIQFGYFALGFGVLMLIAALV